MIRVNLLAVERERSKKPLVAISAAQRVTFGASLLLLLTVLGIGWWFWSLRQQSLALDREIGKAEGETQQLRSVLSQVQKFETRKAQLQQRVTLIEQLRRGQSRGGGTATRRRSRVAELRWPDRGWPRASARSPARD